jgi:hypothetical protein
VYFRIISYACYFLIVLLKGEDEVEDDLATKSDDPLTSQHAPMELDTESGNFLFVLFQKSLIYLH